MSRGCIAVGCGRVHYARGWCAMHYGRWWTHVGPTGPVVCDCPSSTPEHIRLFDAWQCSVCYRKCDAPVAVAS